MSSTVLPAPPSRIDTETLREVAEDPELHRASIARLEAALARPNLRPTEELALRARLGSELRALGRYDEALPVLAGAVSLASAVEDRRQAQRARVQLAQVHSERGDHERADRMFDGLLAESDEMCDLTRAFALQHAGHNHFAQGRYDQAVPHFAAALRLRERVGAPAELVAWSKRCLNEARRRLGRTSDTGDVPSRADAGGRTLADASARELADAGRLPSP